MDNPFCPLEQNSNQSYQPIAQEVLMDLITVLGLYSYDFDVNIKDFTKRQAKLVYLQRECR
jgi:hypothetical protein